MLRPEFRIPSLIEGELDRFSHFPETYALFIESVRTGNGIDPRMLGHQLSGSSLMDSPLIERLQNHQYGLISLAIEALRARLGESIDQIDKAIELAEQRVGKNSMRDIAGALRIGTERFTNKQVKEFQDLGPIPEHKFRARYHLVYPLSGGRIKFLKEYAFPVVARNIIDARYP